MIRRPPRSTQGVSSAASDVYKRQVSTQSTWDKIVLLRQRFICRKDKLGEASLTKCSQVYNSPCLGMSLESSENRSFTSAYKSPELDLCCRSSSLVPGIGMRYSPVQYVNMRKNPFANSDSKFSTPKIVRAKTVHINEEDSNEICRSRKFSGELSREKDLLKKEDREEINRIFKANSIKRKIGFDILLDNYKKHIHQRLKNAITQSSPKVPNQKVKDNSKVFARGKFIGYLKTGIDSRRRFTLNLNHADKFNIHKRISFNIKKQEDFRKYSNPQLQ
eukprot:TRINITY_DN2905_c0_g1_i2.p1 TRINITY_DN2905_c0_g1~~TRINITY_DN2905_c0_g1_i2.p1  ORF type:complete len:276 (+),score=54.04 TRINITY_DN2905_c0_g1_i2:120-947(+)